MAGIFDQAAFVCRQINTPGISVPRVKLSDVSLDSWAHRCQAFFLLNNLANLSCLFIGVVEANTMVVITDSVICAAPVKGVNVMTFQFISQGLVNMIRVFAYNALQDLRHPVGIINVLWLRMVGF
ncbi:hypothetical protein A8B82_22865 [Sulfitobacter sp. EhC04]|nr:hypothetical protein A8B82_22865 [Sulfitobacter sp. EhC04]